MNFLGKTINGYLFTKALGGGSLMAIYLPKHLAEGALAVYIKYRKMDKFMLLKYYQRHMF